MNTKMKLYFFLMSLTTLAINLSGQSIETITDDGAWCWFSDPRAIYSGEDGNRQIVTGWVTKEGDVEAASLNLTSGKISTKVIYPKLEIDDHNNPAFLELPDHRILTMFTWHSGARGVIQSTTSLPDEISSFEKPIVFKPKTKELLDKYVRETYTYANPIRLSSEQNKVYCFGRWIGYKPNMITSTDNGKTWSDPKIVITSPELDTNNRPYVKYYSDGNSRIHLVFTDGHPRPEPLNSVYYCYYEDGAFWKADGTKICTIDELPFHPSDATSVYKATKETGRAWIFDIVADEKGFPIIAYSRYPRLKVHDYYYTRYDGEKWNDHKIIYSGPWFPEDIPDKTQREVNYSAGLTIDPLDPTVIFFSHVIDGVFEISRGETPDFGAHWGITPVTRNSTHDNVRPFVPRYRKSGEKNVVLWMNNRHYYHYTQFDGSIKYMVFPE